MPADLLRYTYSERLCHWLNAAAYCYCLATGLAFYTPHLFWLAITLGGGPTSRFWHPLAGVAFFALAIWMHRTWRGGMNLTDADREWLAKSKAYATNDEANVPAQGRFNAGQKVFFHAMFWGAAALLLSGLVVWFPERMPAGLRGIAILLHEVSALVTIGAFIVHLYMGLFVVPGSMAAILHGRVTRQWAAAHHRLWLRDQ
jgi:formate dehydrogenase subunit gamma